LKERLQTTEYAPAPPPCERTRQTPRPDPTLLLKRSLELHVENAAFDDHDRA
jgi:hypothetical protein